MKSKLLPLAVLPFLITGCTDADMAHPQPLAVPRRVFSTAYYITRAVNKRHSKAEKLLRIAENGGIALLTRGPDFFEAAAAPSLSAMTVAELREVAKERGIKVTTKMTKTALVELLGA